MLMHRAKKLAGISPKSWEHPADKAALSVLKGTAGLDELIKMLVGGTTERSIRLLYVSSSVKVSERQFPKVRVILERALEVLDWPDTPDVFVTNNPYFNAGVYGVREPFIVLNSSLLRSLDEDELYCAVAHELGHIMSGHGLYKTVLWVLLSLSVSTLPLAGILVKPLLLALREWDRMSELTADRAALLALQSEQENYQLLMKMAGGDDLSQMDVNEFFAQAMEYENQKGFLDTISKLLNTAGALHPFPVVRLQELKTWAMSGQYKAILNGSYVRRGNEGSDPREDVKEAFEHYKARAQENTDSITKTVKGVGETLGKAAGDLRDVLKDRLKDR